MKVLEQKNFDLKKGRYDAAVFINMEVEMKKKFFIFLIMIISSACVFAGSLYSNPNGKSLYEDRKARNVGELLSIIIREDAQSTSTNSDNKSKSVSLDGKAGTGVLNMIPQMGAGMSSSMANGDTTKRSGSLSARVSAKIEKIDNSGNLYVRGIRRVLINNEQQEIEISGYVRPNDISVDNTVESAYLADAEVKYNGKLAFDGKAKPGMISNVLGSIIGFFF